jgi:hypothetical protein
MFPSKGVRAMARNGKSTRARPFRLAAALSVSVALTLLASSSALANVSPHGANSLETPHLFVDFWGPQWQSSYTSGGYSISQYRTYLLDFLTNLSQDPTPLSPLVQYGLQNSVGIYVSSWNDTANNPPAAPSVDNYGAEVSRAAEHFGDAGAGQNVNDIILVASPPGHDPPGFGSTLCAYHTYAQFEFGGLGPTPWIALPYQTDSTRCGTKYLNKNDSFGNGYFDGVTHAAFHEIAETISDYDGYGWWGPGGASQGEIGDACNNYFVNFGVPNTGHYYAIQPVWSNSSGGCSAGAGVATVSVTGNAGFGDQNIDTPSSFHVITVTNTFTGPYPLGGAWTLVDHTNSYSLTGNTCPVILQPAQSCQVDVRFTPSKLGTLTAQLSSDLPYNPDAVITLTGIGTVGLSAEIPVTFPVQFASTGIHGPAGVATLMVTNKQKSTLTFKPAVITGTDAADFAIAKSSCGSTGLTFGQSCTVQLRFTPATTGSLSANLTLPSSQGPLSGVIGGIATGPGAQVTGKALQDGVVTFPPSDSVKDSPSQAVTLRDNGQAALSIEKITASGAFSQASDCPKLLKPKASCTIKVRLAARHDLYQTGTLTIASNAAPSVQRIALRAGVEGSYAAADPGTVSFGTVRLGHKSSRRVELQGLESSPFKIISIRASGPFTAASKCPKILVAPQCVITVSIRPARAGRLSGVLTIVTSASDKTIRVPLSAVARK